MRINIQNDESRVAKHSQQLEIRGRVRVTSLVEADGASTLTAVKKGVSAYQDMRAILDEYREVLLSDAEHIRTLGQDILTSDHELSQQIEQLSTKNRLIINRPEKEKRSIEK